LCCHCRGDLANGRADEAADRIDGPSGTEPRPGAGCACEVYVDLMTDDELLTCYVLGHPAARRELGPSGQETAGLRGNRPGFLRKTPTASDVAVRRALVELEDRESGDGSEDDLPF
jgi:hypothetical protein